MSARPQCERRSDTAATDARQLATEQEALNLEAALTLVHFSAQRKPFWSHLPVFPCLVDWGKSCTQLIQQTVLTLSRKVDVSEPLICRRQ